MKHAVRRLLVSLGLCLLGHAAWAAELAIREQFAFVPQFPKEQLPVKKVAISAMNVRLGVHLERLTLLSGEGNTGKKVTGAVLAGATTLMGLGGGIDFAEKEPVEDHLPAADAQAIADDIAKLLAAAVGQSGLELVDPAAVTASAAYASAEGEAKISNDTENIKGSLFKPSFFFGYQQVPVMGYKFRKKPFLNFGFPTDATSARVREAVGVPLTLAWSVSLVNDRKVMRVRELTLNCFGSPGGTAAEDKLWASVTLDPDTLSVPSGESHKNLEYWAALSPQLAAATQEMTRRLASKFTVAAN